MMPEESYKNNEVAFLGEVADKLSLKDNTRLVFIERFQINNDDLNNAALADVLLTNLRHNNTMRDALRRIFKKLEVEGCHFNDATRDKVNIARQWLREVLYPWYQLKNMATSTNKMGPVLQGMSTMDMYTVDPHYPKTVPLDSEIKFEVRLERRGYLTLLERGTSGEFYCLSPSFLGALPIFDAGVVSLPMEGAPVDYFRLDGKPGVEEIIAGISQERPRLSWLPQGDQPPLLLEGKHLQEFLTYFQAESDSTLWYMFYDVV
ncbi:MAG: DUF4384 domain-containing protein [Trichodesmium sp. St18_bin3_1_1]|nr:DUF4384 domain-containing protein [Trichodesmium sp. St18_bin3_1_1]